jgi:LPXTG-motif cell wall-anchored protein
VLNHASCANRFYGDAWHGIHPWHCQEKSIKKIISVGALALTTLTLTAGSVDAGAEPEPIATIATNGGFNTLVAAVGAADPAVLAAIDDCEDGPVTVFAPTDAAFAALPEGTIDALLADPATLTDILLYHVVPGSVDAAAAIAADGTDVTAANGDPISIAVVDGSVVLNGSATVTTTDIVACNGIIHVIDAVILPPADAPADDPLPATGSNLTLAIVAFGLLAAGSVLFVGSRRNVTV